MEILINIDVDDLSSAEIFYTNAFDLKVTRRFDTQGVELSGASAKLYLLVKEEGTRANDRATDRRTYARHWTPVHLDFVVPDVKAALDRVQAAGGNVESQIDTRAWGSIAYCSDPFGHGFCVLQFLNRGYDEIAGATQPESHV